MDAGIQPERDICGRLIRSLRHDVKGRLRVNDIIAALDKRAYALLMMLLALPNCIPGPTIIGMSTLLGLPVVIFCIEAALGRPYPRLPDFAGKFRMNRYKLIRHLERARPYVLNIENMMKPRWLHIAAKHKTHYAICLFYCIALAVPIPAGNLVSAWAIVILTLGLVMQDGIAVVVGHAVGLFALIWNGLIVFLGVEAVYFLMEKFNW